VKLFRLLFAAGIAFALTARGGEGDWKKEVSSAPPGNFPELPSVKMHFVFGWSNVLEAGEANATILRKGGEYRAVATGGSKGLARALWSLDAQHTAAVLAPSLQSKRFAQIERYSKRTIETQVLFDDTGLKRLRKTSGSKDPEKWKRVNFTPIHDIIGGILYVRSQPLKTGDKIGLVCFPTDSPYLVVVTVGKRETIQSMGRDHPAIRLSLDIRKLEVKKKIPTTAVGYEKFKSGTVWVSDDDLRLPLRAEISVFIGFVYGELTDFEKL
jgi:hypothetical protein